MYNFCKSLYNIKTRKLFTKLMLDALKLQVKHWLVKSITLLSWRRLRSRQQKHFWSFGLELGLWTSRILFAKSSTSFKKKPQTQLKMGPPKPRSKRAAMDMDDGYSPMGQKKSKVGFKVNKVQNGYIISKRPFWESLFFLDLGWLHILTINFGAVINELIMIFKERFKIFIRHKFYLFWNL